MTLPVEIQGITWKNVHMLCQKITKKMLKYDEDNGIIVGIGRGGLIPAVMLSHQTKFPVVPVVWQTRELDARKDSLQTLVLAIDRPSTIFVVDDINDTGKTFIGICDELDRLLKTYKLDIKIDVITVCLFERHRSRILADVVGETLEDSRWVTFPWEKAEFNG